MWPNIIAFQSLCLIGTILKTSYAVYLPEQSVLTGGQIQQSIFGETYAADDDAGLNILNDPRKRNEFFRSLTTEDAIYAFDDVPTDLEPNSRLRNIVLGYRSSGQPAGPSSIPHSMNHGHPASLEISMSTIGGYPVYHTPIALGNPAQPFRAWLNLNLDGLYVRSAACSKRDCGRGFTYDPENSATRKSSGQRFEVYPKDWTVGGNVSNDTLHLVSVQVDDAMVGEIDKYEGEDLFYYVMEFVADG